MFVGYIGLISLNRTLHMLVLKRSSIVTGLRSFSLLRQDSTICSSVFSKDKIFSSLIIFSESPCESTGDADEESKQDIDEEELVELAV